MTRRGFLIAFAVVLCLAVAALPRRPGVAQTLAELARTVRVTGNGLFGSTELEAGSLRALPQWTRVLADTKTDRDAFERCTADPVHCSTPILRNWRKIITSAARLDRHEQLKAVNDFFNQWPYKRDRELYGLREYWATPREFMTRSGDCEDYSIAKYFALRRLGFSKDALRIVILWDRIRGIGHVVLAIYLENDILILDSLSNLILSHSRYKHYVPQYSMNETTRWAHIGGHQRKVTPPYRGLLARH